MKIEMHIHPETQSRYFSIKYSKYRIFAEKYIMYVIYCEQYKLNKKVNQKRFHKVGRENGIFGGVVNELH